MVWQLRCGVCAVGCLALGLAEPAQAEAAVFIEGARLHAANGLDFDAAGRLYVASVFGSEIVVLDRFTGQALTRYGLDEGVDGPDDLTIGPDGSLYWTSLVSGEVGRRTPQGAVTLQFVAPGVNPIAFSDEGRLVVALDFLGDALYELDPAFSLPPRLIASDFGQLNGFDFGPDGLLYAPVFTQGEVVRIDIDSCEGATDPYAECDVETVADGFFLPAAVKFDADGELYAVDQSGEVLHVDVESGETSVIATLRPGLDNLAFAPGGGLFVSSSNDGYVVRLSPWKQTIARGGAIAPGGLAVLPGGRLFVADIFSLREYGLLLGLPKDVETNFTGVAGITAPTALSADGERLIVSSWLAGQVQIFDPDADVPVETYSDFGAPLAALRLQGDLVVADLISGSVVRQVGADRETLASGLGVPAGLAAQGGDLFVSDFAAGTVLQVVDDGEVLTPPVVIASGLAEPEGLAVDAQGRVLVVESGAGVLRRISPGSGTSTVLASGLKTGLEGYTGAPPAYVIAGVTTGPLGQIYVSGDRGNEIYRISP